ncbi:DUF935 domain-containing protein [Sneathiella sp.]|uniref:DUF935 domain-containing protein n=1 Tax=Sneathiella sp. TaxID=1964365 RepID=UPI002FE31FF0
MAVILNSDGTPMRKEVLLEEVAAPTMTGVRSVLAGHPAQGLTPPRLASLLRAAEQGDPLSYFELAEELEEKDLHYLGVIGTRKRSVSGLELVVEAADNSKAAQLHADFVRDVLNRDTIQEELFDVLDATGKGVSFVEIMWEKSAKQWTPGRLEWRDPRWFTFAVTDGRTPLLRDGASGMPLPDFKFIFHEVKAKSGIPIRGGLARAISWYYMFKNFAVKDWVVFAEVYGQPIRIGKYHKMATEEDKAVLRRAVGMIGTDAAAIIPDSMMIEFVQAASSGGSSGSGNGGLYSSLANWIDQQVSKAILGQTTTTDAISGGHAVSKEHQEVRLDIQQSDARQLAATLNRQLVRPLIDLNFGPQDVYPKLSLPIPESLDMQAFASAVKTAADAQLKIPAKWVRDKMGIPEPEEDEEVIGNAPLMPAFPQPDTENARARHSGTFALAGAASRPIRDIDQLTEAAIVAADSAATKMIDQVREIMESSSDLADFASRLLDAYPDMDVREMGDVIGEALAVADLAGRAALLDG